MVSASHSCAPGISLPAPWPPPLLCCVAQKARDECTTTYGPEDPKCAPLIEAHKVCLRKEGFNVSAVVWVLVRDTRVCRARELPQLPQLRGQLHGVLATLPAMCAAVQVLCRNRLALCCPPCRSECCHHGSIAGGPARHRSGAAFFHRAAAHRLAGLP